MSYRNDPVNVSSCWDETNLSASLGYVFGLERTDDLYHLSLYASSEGWCLRLAAMICIYGEIQKERISVLNAINRVF